MTNTNPLIPYFETSRYKVETMVQLATVREGERAVDLGTGDGRLAIALAQKGALVIAYELNATYLRMAEMNIKSLGLSERITIKREDFWTADLSDFSIVTIYPMPDIMAELETKLTTELKKGSRVLTNYYEFPNLKPSTVRDSVYLYDID